MLCLFAICVSAALMTRVAVSKVTLDIICLTAFGYEVDSLHNPNSELADAYHQLLDLQSGESVYYVSSHIRLTQRTWLLKAQILVVSF